MYNYWSPLKPFLYIIHFPWLSCLNVFNIASSNPIAVIKVVVWKQKEAEGANCRVCGLTPGSSVKLRRFILLSTFISVLCVCVRVSQSEPCRSRRCQCDFGWGFSLFLEAGSCLFWFHFSSLKQPRIKLLTNDSYSVQSDSRVVFFWFFFQETIWVNVLLYKPAASPWLLFESQWPHSHVHVLLRKYLMYS